MSAEPVRLFLGGYPGAGKTYMTHFLANHHGWNSLGLDVGGYGNHVLRCLDLPETDPVFSRSPLVAEGGFLHEAPRFSEMIERVGFVTFWLTGTRKQLTESRLNRMAHWESREHIIGSDWTKTVDLFADKVRWDFTISMWNDDNTRKSGDQVLTEMARLHKPIRAMMDGT